MPTRYRLFRRGTIFYCHDADTGKQASLQTTDRTTARRLLHAKEEALQLPAINLQIARAYLHAVDPAFNKRTWGDAIIWIKETKQEDTRRCWDEGTRFRLSFSPPAQPSLRTTPEPVVRAPLSDF